MRACKQAENSDSMYSRYEIEILLVKGPQKPRSPHLVQTQNSYSATQSQANFHTNTEQERQLHHVFDKLSPLNQAQSLKWCRTWLEKERRMNHRLLRIGYGLNLSKQVIWVGKATRLELPVRIHVQVTFVMHAGRSDFVDGCRLPGRSLFLP